MVLLRAEMEVRLGAQHFAHALEEFVPYALRAVRRSEGVA